MASSLLLPCAGTSVSVKLHPVVLFAICDAYIRRGEKQERVIGTLLGVVSDNVVEVKSCYVVPHNESAEQVGRAGNSLVGRRGMLTKHENTSSTARMHPALHYCMLLALANALFTVSSVRTADSDTLQIRPMRL